MSTFCKHPILGNTLRQLGFFATVLVAVQFSIISCSTDGNYPDIQTTAKIDTFKNLYAPSGTSSSGRPIPGRFVKFSFSKNDTISSGDEWDIAFSGFNIIFNGGTKVVADGQEPSRTGNGGVYYVDSLFHEITIANSDRLKQDALRVYALASDGGETSWYDYNPTTHIAIPKAKRVLVIRTHDGKYAKMQIVSIYKDAPATPTNPYDLNYYTFYFYYNSSGGAGIKTN